MWACKREGRFQDYPAETVALIEAAYGAYVRAARAGGACVDRVKFDVHGRGGETHYIDFQEVEMMQRNIDEPLRCREVRRTGPEPALHPGTAVRSMASGAPASGSPRKRARGAPLQVQTYSRDLAVEGSIVVKTAPATYVSPEKAEKARSAGEPRKEKQYSKRMRALGKALENFGEVRSVTLHSLTAPGTGGALGDVTVALGGEKDFYLGADTDNASTFFAVVAFPIRSWEQGRAALDLLLEEPALAPILASNHPCCARGFVTEGGETGEYVKDLKTKTMKRYVAGAGEYLDDDFEWDMASGVLAALQRYMVSGVAFAIGRDCRGSIYGKRFKAAYDSVLSTLKSLGSRRCRSLTGLHAEIWREEEEKQAAARLEEQVAEEEDWSVENLRKYLEECESEEGRAEYGEDQCDTELTRLWKRIDGIQTGA